MRDFASKRLYGIRLFPAVRVTNGFEGDQYKQPSESLSGDFDGHAVKIVHRFLPFWLLLLSLIGGNEIQ